MASNSSRRSGSSGRSTSRKQVHLRPPDRRVSDRAQRTRDDKDAPRPARKAPAGRGGRFVSTKRELREQRAVQLRRRARFRVAAAALAVVAVAGAAFQLYRSQAFAVTRVEVVGNARLTADHVRALAAVPPDATLLRFPDEPVRERVAADPWVASVLVSRDFPDGMRIRIVEREPAALLDLGQTAWLVDRRGWVLARHAVEETSPLVAVRGLEDGKPVPGRRFSDKGLANALALLDALSPEMRAQTRSVNAPSVDQTSLITKGGVEVLFGRAEDVARKDVVAREIMREQGRGVVFIDVRTVERPVSRGLGE